MKTTLLYICFALLVGSLSAQSVYNFDNPDFSNGPAFLHVTIDSSVYMTGLSNNDFMFGGTGVYRSTFDASHTLDLTDRLEGFWGEIPFEMSVFGLNNGDFIIAARITGCDYGLPLTVGVFDRYGSPYFEPFHAALNYSDEPKISFVSNGIDDADTIIAISDPSQTLLMSYDGMNTLLVDEVLAYDEQIVLDQGFLSVRDDLILLQDENFNTVVSSETQGPILSIDTMQHGYAVLTTDSIFILNQDMQPVFRHAPDSSYILLLATTEHIWLLQENGYVAKYNHELNLDTIYSIPFPSRISDAKHVGDVIHIAGQYTTGYETSRFHVKTDANAFLKETPPDVSLVTVRVADTVRTRPRPWGSVNYLDIDYGHVYVTLHNPGQIPIENVDIKMRQQHCPGICSGAYELTYTLNSLNLEPGQIREYFLGDLSFECAAFAPEELCMWVVAPNRRPDLNPAESPVCAEIGVVTGTDPVLFTGEVDIYPNPTRGEVFIDSEKQLLSFEVFNIMGQVIDQGEFQMIPYQIDLGDLQNGTYLIALQDVDHNYAAERVILIR